MPLVRVAVWLKHPGDLLGEAIQFATHGLGEHAGFIRGNGTVHELYFPKVRDRDLAAGETSLMEIYDIEGLTPELSTAMEAGFDKNLAAGIKYSITDLFRIELDETFPLDTSGVCSCYVAHCLMCDLPEPLWPLVRIDPSQISPRDIRLSPRLHLPPAATQ